MMAAAAGPRIEDLDIHQVWAALGGGPLRGNRGRAFWRDGDGWNITLDRSKGAWYDQRDHIGGGIVALVELTIGVDRRAALAWLGVNFGVTSISPTSTYSLAERREFARRREQARAVAERLIERRDEVFDMIREAKRKKLEEYHLLNRAAHEVEDIDLLAEAENVWGELEALDTKGDSLLAATDAATLKRLLSERRAA